MANWISSILVLFCLISIQSSWADDRQTFLRESQKIVKFYEVANHVNMVAYQACVCAELQRNGQSHPSCEISNKHSAQFKFLDIFRGSEVSRQYSCSDLINVKLYNLIKDNYRPMRIRAALSQADIFSIANEEARNLETETINEDKRFQYNARPTHKFSVDLAPGVSVVQMPPLDYSEIRDVQEIYNSDLQYKCVEFTSKYGTEFRSLSGLLGESVIKNLCSYLLDRQLGFSKDFSGARKDKILEIQRNYIRWAASSRGAFKYKMLMEYNSFIQDNPMVLLVSSDRPSLNELATILQVLVKNSESRMNSHYSPSADINQYIYYPYAMSYAQSRLRASGWSGDRVDKVIIGIEQELNQQAKRDAILQLATYTGLFVLCYSPLPARAVGGLVAAVAARNLCFVGLSVLDTGRFLYMNMREYHRELQNFFSSADGNAYITRFSELNVTQANQYVALSMLPFAMGTNLGNIPKVFRLVR